MKTDIATFPRRQDDKYWSGVTFLAEKFATACTQWKADIIYELEERRKNDAKKQSYEIANYVRISEILGEEKI